MILLDTSVIIDVLRGRPGRRELIRALLGEGHELVCCAINVTEVYSGMRAHEAEATAGFMDSLKYIEIDRDAAREAGELRLEWRRKERTLSLPDAIISAVALRNNLSLATDNVRHFSMLGLKLVSLSGV